MPVADLLPESGTARSWNFPATRDLGGRDEEVEIHGDAGCLCAQASRGGSARGRAASEVRDLASDLLRVAKEVRRPRCRRDAAPSRARGGKQAPEGLGGGLGARQANPAGGPGKKGLKPARRRQLTREIYARHPVSVRRACGLALLGRSTWYRRSKRPKDIELRMRMRDLAAARPRFGYLRIYRMLRREGRI